MSNPFLGLITSTFKQIHKDMIDAVLDETGLTQPIRFVYTGTRYVTCNNCVPDPIGGKSSNVFLDGGPMYFHNGQLCPMCGGNSKRMVEDAETIYMMIGWNSKGWVPMASNAVEIPSLAIQSQCKAEYLPQIRRVSYIEVMDIEGYGTQRFQRLGDPEYCGLNNNTCVLCMWTKIG